MERKPNPSDLTDSQWLQLKPLLPAPCPRSRPLVVARREIVNAAILYLLRAGCAWRSLPHDLPDWRLVYHYFRTWDRDGIWERLQQYFHAQVRIKDARLAVGLSCPAPRSTGAPRPPTPAPACGSRGRPRSARPRPAPGSGPPSPRVAAAAAHPATISGSQTVAPCARHWSPHPADAAPCAPPTCGVRRRAALPGTTALGPLVPAAGTMALLASISTLPPRSVTPVRCGRSVWGPGQDAGGR